MNTELLNTISTIEAKNAKNFNDPFYSYLIVLDEIYYDYLANSRMCTGEGILLRVSIPSWGPFRNYGEG